MKTLMSLIKVLAFPLIVLNTLGGIISGVWLATLGEWAAVGYGMLILILAPRFLSWSLRLPSMLFQCPMDSSSNGGKTLGTIVAASLRSVYRLVLITIWCCSIFFMFVMSADESNLMLRLIWSYGIAIGPWGFLASKEPDHLATAISTFLAELAYITLILYALFAPIIVLDALKIFGVFMVIALTLEIFMVVTIDNEPEKLTAPSI